MYRDGWGPKAIQRKLESMGNLFSWSTIKDVIKKYQRGQIGYAHPDQEPIPAFKVVSDNDIVEIQNEFLNSCTLDHYKDRDTPEQSQVTGPSQRQRYP